MTKQEERMMIWARILKSGKDSQLSRLSNREERDKFLFSSHYKRREDRNASYEPGKRFLKKPPKGYSGMVA